MHPDWCTTSLLLQEGLLISPEKDMHGLSWSSLREGGLDRQECVAMPAAVKVRQRNDPKYQARLSPSRKRDGRKRSGSGQCLASWCMQAMGATTVAPLGIAYPPTSVFLSRIRHIMPDPADIRSPSCTTPTRLSFAASTQSWLHLGHPAPRRAQDVTKVSSLHIVQCSTRDCTP